MAKCWHLLPNLCSETTHGQHEIGLGGSIYTMKLANASFTWPLFPRSSKCCSTFTSAPLTTYLNTWPPTPSMQRRTDPERSAPTLKRCHLLPVTAHWPEQATWPCLTSSWQGNVGRPMNMPWESLSCCGKVGCRERTCPLIIEHSILPHHLHGFLWKHRGGGTL